MKKKMDIEMVATFGQAESLVSLAEETFGLLSGYVILMTGLKMSLLDPEYGKRLADGLSAILTGLGMGEIEDSQLKQLTDIGTETYERAREGAN